MNVIRFNEPFEAAIKTWNGKEPLPFHMGHPTIGGQSEGLLKRQDWRNSPLFQYYGTREKEKDLINGMLQSGTLLESCAWPFDTFRLALVQTCPTGWEEPGARKRFGEGRYVANFVVQRQAEQIHFLGNAIRLYDETPPVVAMARRYNPLILYIADAHTTLDNPVQYRYHKHIFAGGRWLSTGGLADDLNLAMGMMDSIAGFILDAMEPSNYIASVEPNEPTRSVEWRKARTHYTLIHHGHPINRKPNGKPVSFKIDLDEPLIRTAHDRRGYYKTLKHPRYRFALAEQRYPNMPPGTIKVKPCWVGPKEWRDEGGKQIYRILEPIEERKVA